MKIIIHNLLNGTNRDYEGDAKSLVRTLDEEYPWATQHADDDLNYILSEIDRHQFFAVEVVDSSPHPFLRS